ncbi:MAG TPA: M1 family metallopeptidase [Polyangiaceae bacterium]|nr:M1 family metallopeptidase [Polyangiaceae bacterium]
MRRRATQAAGRLRAPLAAASFLSLALASCEPAPAARPPAAAAPPPAPPRFGEAPPPRADGRLGNEGLVPLAYDLHLQIDPAAERFQGEATLKVRVDAPAPAVVVHGRGLRVLHVEAAQGATRLRGAATVRPAAGTRGEPEEVALGFEAPLPRGEVSIVVRYDAAFPRGLRGLYRVHEGGASYAFTHFEPSDARRAFPCFDEPGVKVPVTLAIDVPAGQRAFANMPEAGQRPSADGRWVTVSFAPSPPLPSYLVAFAVGPFDVAEGRASVPLRLVAPKGKASGEYALAAASGLLQKLEAYFGRPYAYPKLDLVAVPNFGAGAMENPGFITFREELLLFDEAGAPTRDRRRSAEVIAHELGHQWFGNLVTARWWDDLWLNEGFATFATHKALDPWRPAWGAALDLVERKGSALEIDALPSARAVRQPVRSTSEALEAFDPITYTKGASILRMLEHQVGPGPFQAGLKAYLGAHAHGNATSGELLAALEQASGKPVGAVASSFLDRPGVPLVRAKLECKGGPARVLLRQSPLAAPPAPPGEGPAPPWRVPVCVAFGDPRQVRCTTLEGREGAVELGPACPAWFLPNADEAGYYRYALEPADLERLERRRFAPLTDAERVGLLSNAGALVLAGELGADRALALARSFAPEGRRAVVASVIDLYALLREKVAEGRDLPRLEALVRKALGPAHARLGWAPDAQTKPGAKAPRPGEPDASDDAALVRVALIDALASIGHDEAVLREARRRADAFLSKQGPEQHPDNVALALRAAARRGDAALWDALSRALAGPNPPQTRVAISSALASFEDPALLRRTLDLTLTDRVRLQDLRYIFPPAFARRDTSAAAFAWARDHADALARRLPPSMLSGLSALLGSACTEAERDERGAFLADKLRGVEGSGRALALALDRANACVAARAREAPRLAAALDKAK